MTTSNNSLSRRAFLQQGAAATGVALAAGNAAAAQKTSATSAKAQYDFVIAGGGHNSLACAAYLAKAGYKCVVLEAKPTAGGNTATEELTIPGYKHEPCANTPAGLHRSAIKDELQLEEKWGLEFARQQELACVQIQGDGAGIPVWTGDVDRTLAELARFSKTDAERMRKLLGTMRPYERAVNTFSTAPIGYAPSVEEQLMRRPDGAIWLRRHRQSSYDFIIEHFKEPHVRTFAAYWSGMARQPPFAAETGTNGMRYFASVLRGGWQTLVGGTGSLPAALTRLLEAHDCPVLTGKFVVNLVIENGRCVGVETADGEIYRARQAVVSTLHPNQLVQMAPAELGETFVQAINEYQTSTPLALFTIHLALREAPQWQANGKSWTCVESGYLSSMENWLSHAHACQEGRVELDAVPVMHTLTPSLIDPSRTPDGGHTLKVETVYPYELAQGGPARWDEIKQQVAEVMLKKLQAVAPNLSGSNIIGGPRVFSPLDIAGRNINNVGGSCHGGVESISQMGEMRPVPGWASHRMPIKGLYQTGNTTHPGGGVNAMAGRNAAWVVLDDLGTTIPEVIERSRTRT